MSDYAETVWEFVQAITPEKLRHSDDLQAAIARRSIANFQEYVGHPRSVGLHSPTNGTATSQKCSPSWKPT